MSMKELTEEQLAAILGITVSETERIYISGVHSPHDPKNDNYSLQYEILEIAK